MRRPHQIVYTLFILIFILEKSQAQKGGNAGQLSLPAYVTDYFADKSFTIAAGAHRAPIYVDTADWKGVLRAAGDLSDDVRKISGMASILHKGGIYKEGSILVGTIGKSRIIDKLIADKKLDVRMVKGQWESFVIQTVDGNLVIAGSDKRGTIYGIYDVSEKMGVSPWYWWADAPVRKCSSLYVKQGRYLQPSPKVKYRGIFINDEEPSFAGWARNKFGGINAHLYVNIFELLLRLKANYLWPAMWGKAFNEDDPMNPIMADEYGIVMGTSHHEPMMRAQKEYTSRKEQVGPWDYATNAENLKKFFSEGLERNKAFDNLITIGMRGDGDVALGKGNDEENIGVLRKVVADQREIIRHVYGKDPSAVPQLWAIFTEVQRYYDAGLNVPDDVTLLFCDNNWGYIRRTTPLHERNRRGGLGMYYHIDMNGGPWNDRWINTTTIPKLQEQLNLAYQSGIDRIWIVNVGDLKPKELPIDFILRYAWNPDALPLAKVRDYTVNWAERIFGKKHAIAIADLVSLYPKYNLWRKPEVQVPRIFSFVNYNEADSVSRLWQQLVARAEAIEKQLPDEAKNAYYQLVLYPVKASAGVAQIYLAAGRNNLYANQGRVSANDQAQRARTLFEQDKQLSDYYNGPMASGKWSKMMQDIHIGYERWSMPIQSKLPDLQEVKPLPIPSLGVAVEGSENAWPGSTAQAALPVFDPLKINRAFIDVFNRGVVTFEFKATSDKEWIKLNKASGSVQLEERICVEVDWHKMPAGKHTGTITIQQGEVKVMIAVSAVKQFLPVSPEPYFGNLTGEFSIPATQYNKNIPGTQANWIVLPDLGRGAASMGVYPVTAPSVQPASGPRLEYKIYLPGYWNNYRFARFTAYARYKPRPGFAYRCLDR